MSGMKQIDSESPREVASWLRSEAADLWPAMLGSLSLRRSRCIRENCPACLSGEQHQSYVLYGRANGRRVSVYVPEELVPEVQRALNNGRALQDLLHQIYQGAEASAYRSNEERQGLSGAGRAAAGQFC